VALSALSACNSDVTGPGGSTTLDFAHEFGVLNYVYALSQLEADMYDRVRLYWYVGMLASERSTLQSEYFEVYDQKYTLQTTQKTQRITDFLMFDYSTVNFLDRASSLGMVKTIAEATANGYAGALTYLTTQETRDQVTTIADAATVRATAVRAMLGQGAFTPVAATPQATMTALSAFYRTKLTIINAGASA